MLTLENVSKIIMSNLGSVWGKLRLKEGSAEKNNYVELGLVRNQPGHQLRLARNDLRSGREIFLKSMASQSQFQNARHHSSKDRYLMKVSGYNGEISI